MANYEITNEDINAFVMKGGDVSLLESWQIKLISPEVIEDYISKGNSSMPFTKVYGVKFWERFDDHVIDQYAVNGGRLTDILRTQARHISRQAIDERIAMGGSLTGLTEDQRLNISPKAIDEYVAKGGDLNGLTVEQMENISQSAFDKYVAAGGYLDPINFSMEEQRANVSPESIIKYIENGGSLGNLIQCSMLTEQDAVNLSSEVIDKYIENGGAIFDLNEEQIKNISPESIQKRIINFKDDNLDLDGLSQEQIASIPQRAFYENWANGGRATQIDEKSKEKLGGKPSQEMVDAVILYSGGKITKDEIPLECYGNYRARSSLFSIIESNTKDAFNTVCNKYGFEENVPQDLVEKFDEKISEIKDELEIKKEKSVDNVIEETKNAEIESKKSAAKEEIQGFGW